MSKKPNHIAVVRLSAMGDVAMLVPALQVLRTSYPDLRITLVSKPFHKPIFDTIPDLEFFAADVEGRHKGISGMHRLSKELKARGVTHLADCHNVLRAKLLRMFMRYNGVKRAVIDKGRAEKRELCRPVKKQWKPLKSSHQRYADTFNELGFSIELNDFKPLDRVALPKVAAEFLDGWSGKLLGIAPFAAFASKVYSDEQMRKVLQLLNEKQNLKMLLFGGPNEVEKLQAMASDLDNAIVVAGELNFKEELALISNLDGMLAMDSGNGHLAANYGIPVLTIWGVTHPYLGFAPYGQPESNWLLPDLEKYPAIPTSVYGKSYPNGYETAINSIAAEQVVELIYKIV